METRWLYVTSENFAKLRQAAGETCIIPMGCVEKHGLHLPLGTDILEASRASYLASQKETVCVFPDFTFGDYSLGAPIEPEGNVPAGVVTLDMETEMLLLEKLCAQIARNGFKKIMVVNGHGGNVTWLQAFSRKLYNKKCDYVFATYSLRSSESVYDVADVLREKGRGAFPYLTREDEDVVLDFCDKKKEIGHACMGETAMIFATAPEAVHLERLGIESGLSQHKADYLKEAGVHIANDGWDINYPNAFHGHDPVGCNERIGKAAMEVVTDRLAHAIKVFKEDENVLGWLADLQKGW